MIRVHKLLFSTALGWMIVAVSANCAQAVSEIDYPRVPQALILSLSGRHYPAIAHALSTVGFRVREVSAEDDNIRRSGAVPLLIVPEQEGRQLDPESVQRILRNVEDGMPLVLDGSTELAEKLGVKSGATRKLMTRYRWDDYADDPVLLPTPVTYRRLQTHPGLEVLAQRSKHHSPLVVTGSRGKGRFLFSAIPLEPQPGAVYQYLPFLAQAIVDELHIGPVFAADDLCVYLDTDGSPTVDPVTVVAQLKSWSVREVHLAIFYDSKAFREFIPRFLAAAHQQGIAVYAWLEYPMVSREFWNQHPDWREVTASGRPAIIDWRYHMALEDPACFQAVAELTRRLVLDFDWDGVDLAELYFEAESGVFRRPQDCTPMHPTFRRMFEQRYGVDPINLFDPHSPWYGPRNPALARDLKDYRVELVTQLNEGFLQVLADCQLQKPYLQTTLTVIDALRDPAVPERFAVDPERLLALQKHFGFAVEIEDPYTVWNSGPERYRAIGEYYRSRLAPGTPFSLDINVTDRIPRGRPLNKPRGLELYEWLANAASNTDLVTLYAYATFSADDMRLVPFVLGAQRVADAAEGAVTARRQIYWRTDTRGRTVYLDGREWPCFSDSQVLIPAGLHKVYTRPENTSAGPSAIRIESLSGALLQAEQTGHQIEFTYESRGRSYALLNRAPEAILCDGVAGEGRILNAGKTICLVLPGGKHTVELIDR